mmetsp:Transcript_104944/g.197732  ORF Transcript_104944/g.197732 Transcript_104944/m.197732 type:complete len:197 (-) Transcript_104944:71-661(-)
MALYSLYLRPDLPGDVEVVRTAANCQKRWGGVHATLCSFAHKANEIDATRACHGSSLLRTMQAMLEASVPPGLDACKGAEVAGAARWKLNPDEELPDADPDDDLVILRLPHQSPTLCAIAKVAREMGLANARKAKELHITLGPRRKFSRESIEAMRDELRSCTSWRIVIVKCQVGESELCVSQLRESVVLEWPCFA